MIDIGLLRQDPEALRAALARRGVDLDVSLMANLDAEVRRLRHESDEKRARQKEIGKRIASLSGDEKQTAIDEAATLAAQVKEVADQADAADERFQAIWVQVPNPPHESSPDGLTEEDAVEVKRWGEPPSVEFDVLDHQELGESLDVIDVAAGVRLSGTRFAYLKGSAALLEFALVRWALDVLGEEGFTPVVPPVLVREEALFGTGFFPGDREQVYEVGEDDLFLVGTSEVALAGLHMDEILDAEVLPLRYAGFSTCFRREAGTYGKDTRGIFRVHQFDKVEMFAFTHPHESSNEHERLLGIEERIVQSLEIPYRVVNIAAGDLGPSAAKKYDIEAWIPSQGTYRELTSCSNTTDFQARRLKIRFRGDGGNMLVHTLNGTAVAVGRTLVAIFENFQQADGTIVVPEVLRPYAGFETIG